MSKLDRALEALGPLVEEPKAIRCPLPDHEDRRASATLYPNGFYCHACGASMSPLQFFCFIEGITMDEAFERLGVDRGPRPPRRTPESFGAFNLALEQALMARPNFTQEWAIANEFHRHPPELIDRIFTEGAAALRATGIDLAFTFDLCHLLARRAVERRRPRPIP